MRRLTSWNLWGTGKFTRDQRMLARRHNQQSYQVEQLEERVLLSGTGLPANEMGPAPAPTFTEFIVSAQDGFLGTYTANAGAGESLTSIGNNLFTMTVPDAVNLTAMQNMLANNPFVDFVDPNYEINLALTPNDPRYTSGDLWGMQNTGGSGGVVDADIDAPDAWDSTTGSTRFGIGVIDTGIDYTHEDLYLNIWLNQAEIPSSKSGVTDIDSDGLITFYDLNDSSNSAYTTDLNGNGYIDGGDLLMDSTWENGTDEDSNGYTDDLIGWDFASNDNDPMDDNSHGTHCAGTIAGIGNNGTGVVGVNWVGQVAGLKFLTGAGTGTTADAVSAVNYAAAIRADGGNLIATSNSWGGGGYTSSLENAIINARDEGQLFVAAAGNSGASSPSYPALYPQDNVISVAATDRTDTIASFSQYGTSSVDLAAPGVAIVSTTPGDAYDSYNGTSMATPHVAGAVALLYAHKPTATWTEVRDAIFDGVETASTHPNLSSLNGKMVTEGRLHLLGSINELGPTGPGPGSVEFDATTYATTATANVRVTDPDQNHDDGAVETVTVSVKSTTESGGFNVTLTETAVASGVFTADVSIQPGSTPIADSILQVADGDTITATYMDPEPTGTHDDTATIDGAAPAITNVSSGAGSTSASVSWDTSEPATGVVDYGLSAGSLTDSATASTLETSQSVTLSGLSASTTYFYRVTATDAVGNASVDSVRSFTTVAQPELLFVDDDQNNTWESYFTDALDANTLFYDTWTVAEDGAPSAADLSAYSVVLYNCGENYTASSAGLTSAEQAVISQYLENGGNVGLFSQDALYNGLAASFYQTYLGLDSYQSDTQGTTVVGVSGDPIGDGVNTNLSFPPSYPNWGDSLFPQAAAEGVFARSSSMVDYNAIRYDSGDFRSVFFAFAFEALSTSGTAPNNQAAVMSRVVEWLGEEAAPPVPTVSISDATVTEGGSASLTLTLSAASSDDVTVTYATSNGSAVGGDDYTAVPSGSAMIPAGSTLTTISISTIDDALDEAAETFNVNLNGATNATIADGNGVVTITDDDPPPTITINDIVITEGNDGSTSATLTVTLDAASGRAVSVNYATSDGNATTDDGDYNFASGTLNFGAGDTSQEITVIVNGDTKYEDNETFNVNLSAASNATIGDPAGLVTIGDDDLAPDITIDNVEKLEGDSGTTAFTFNVSLSQASGKTATVNYATGDGTALASSDYTATSGLLTFAAGETNKVVTVDVIGDTDAEGNETFDVNLSDAFNANIVDSPGVGTIVEDDLQLAIGDVTVDEGDGTATFIVTLTPGASQEVTVNYQTNNGTAEFGSDYTFTSGLLTFGVGETLKSIPVPITDDPTDEFNETFDVLLSDAVNASVFDDRGEGTIHDDDDSPKISINDTSIVEGDSGSKPANLTVTLNAASGKTVSVGWATANGSAGAGADYTANSGTVTFNPGQTSQMVPVVVLGDEIDEPNEFFNVNLSAASNATIDDATGQVTIIDDDTAEITIDDVTQVEGDSGPNNFTFTVSLSVASSQTVTVDYQTMDGTAVDSSDYNSTAGMLTFIPGQMSQTVSVAVNGDTGEEPDETFTLELSNATNAGLANSTGVGTIVNDDVPEPPLPSFQIVAGVVEYVDSNWWTVNLDTTMDNPVIVTTVSLGFSGPSTSPVTTQMRNVTNTTFDLRVVPLDGFGSYASPVNVYVVAMNAGEYSADGLNIEAGHVDVSVTDRRGSWNGQEVAYQGTYSNPVVLGQVMTANDGGSDPRPSTFWARSLTSRRNIPNSSGMRIGKHVGEDSDRTRPTETVGYIVMESGLQSIGDLQLSAQVTADRVRGVQNNRPYSVNMPGDIDDFWGVVSSSAGMDGNDGGCPAFFDEPSSAGIELAIREDWYRDTEQSHTTEQCAVLFVGTNSTASSAAGAAFARSSSMNRLGTQPARSDAGRVDRPLAGLFSTSVGASTDAAAAPAATQPLFALPADMPSDPQSTPGSAAGGSHDSWWGDLGNWGSVCDDLATSTPAASAAESPLESLLTGGLSNLWGNLL